MEDLQQLEAQRQPAKSTCPPLRAARSPLQLGAWQARLQHHPDQTFARYICEGIQFGFHIGFDRGATQLKSAKRNMPSALNNPSVVDEYLAKELEEGRIIGPVSPAQIATHVNRLGVIPKGGNPGAWRLITDLSFPSGHSVNDGVDPGLCSLSYTSVEKVARAAMLLGKESQLA